MKRMLTVIMPISLILVSMCGCDTIEKVSRTPMYMELDGVCYDGAKVISPFFFTTDGNTFSFIFHNYTLKSESGGKLYLSFRLTYSEPFELGRVYELPSGPAMNYVNMYYYDEKGELHDYYVQDGWLRFIMNSPELNGEFEFVAKDSAKGTICNVTKGRFDLTAECKCKTDTEL